jgi:acetyl esterase
MGIIDVGPRLDPDMRAAMAEAARVAAETKAALDIETVDPFDVVQQRALYNADRKFWNAGGPAMASSEDFTIQGPHGPISLRLHKPDTAAEPAPVLVYLHGGGWIVGGLDTHDRIMRVLAAESGWAVLGVDYRLAPEAKFPIPQEDCAAAADWVLAQGTSKGLDARRLAVGGDSAGANMAMTVILGLRDRGIEATAGLLYYGSYGLRDSASRRLWGGVEDGLSAADLDFFRACLFDTPEGMLDPRFNILANDLSGLPPLYVLEVEMDPLADDSVALTEAVRAAGGRARHRKVAGVLHGFAHMSKMVGKSLDCLTESGAFLRDLG